MGASISVRNVVVSAALDHDVDLDGVASSLDHTKYNPRRFPCVVVRAPGAGATVLVFASGRLVCVGAPSEWRAGLAVRNVVDGMRRCGIHAGGDPDMHVRNVVATADLHGRIRVAEAARSLPHSMYEPEMFSGVVHRIVDSRAVTLLFASGRMVCVGAGSVGEARGAIHAVHAELDGLGLVRYGAEAPG